MIKYLFVILFRSHCFTRHLRDKRSLGVAAYKDGLNMRQVTVDESFEINVIITTFGQVLSCSLRNPDIRHRPRYILYHWHKSL